ncbi:MAG: NUDIX hydrolase [Myxococcales bacterium]|nr:NUDIX hydrolase [Myxococcales bacterium]
MAEKKQQMWRRHDRVLALHTPVFDIARYRAVPPEGSAVTGGEVPRYVIEAPDWVNIIALTADERVVMIEQYRAGTDDLTLEIPGGMVDPGEDPAQAAARELYEETGYTAESLLHIGSIAPNPAIQSNHCHSFVARGLSAGAQALGEGEDISLRLMPLDEARQAVVSGRVTHALVVVAFHFFAARGA